MQFPTTIAFSALIATVLSAALPLADVNAIEKRDNGVRVCRNINFDDCVTIYPNLNGDCCMYNSASTKCHQLTIPKQTNSHPIGKTELAALVLTGTLCALSTRECLGFPSSEEENTNVITKRTILL